MRRSSKKKKEKKRKILSDRLALEELSELIDSNSLSHTSGNIGTNIGDILKDKADAGERRSR